MATATLFQQMSVACPTPGAFGLDRKPYFHHLLAAFLRKMFAPTEDTH